MITCYNKRQDREASEQLEKPIYFNEAIAMECCLVMLFKLLLTDSSLSPKQFY